MNNAVSLPLSLFAYICMFLQPPDVVGIDAAFSFQVFVMEFGFCAVDVLVPLFWVFECVIASVVLLILFAFWLQLRCAVWLLLLVVNTAVVMYLLGWYPVVVVLVAMNWFNGCERSGATGTQYYTTTLRCFSVLQLDSSWNEQMCKTDRERESWGICNNGREGRPSLSLPVIQEHTQSISALRLGCGGVERKEKVWHCTCAWRRSFMVKS